MEGNKINHMKDPKHKISLIIPAYNEENYIGECLDSVIRNSNNELFEIIVVDNASTDDTKKEALKRPGVKVVREERKGLTRARQRGYLEARGSILAYIDADTKMPEGWVKKIIEEFDKDEKLSCLSGPYVYYDMPKYKQFFTKVYNYVLIIPMYWLVGYVAIGGNIAIRKETLDKMNGFDTSIEFYGEDANIARRAYEFGKVKFDLDHFIYTSQRRFVSQGVPDTVKEYGLNFLSEVFLHKPFSNEYKDFR